MPKILLEVICEDLKNIENFEPQKLQIENIGSHFENSENYIDKICTYDNNLISVFGISELHPNKVIKYDARKFSRVDMIEAISAKYEEGQKIKLYQFDEYYIVVEEEKIKVYSERKITALAKVEETIFDKIKSKLSNIFTKKRSCPNLELVYDSNPNRLTNFENKSKFAAKNRMKALLNCEREITRAQKKLTKKEKKMRLDKFLKVSRVIKRRTVANEAADGGRVSVNGKVVKPSYEVKERRYCRNKIWR